MNNTLYNKIIKNIANGIKSCLNEDFSPAVMHKAINRVKKDIKARELSFKDSDYSNEEDLKQLRRRARLLKTFTQGEIDANNKFTSNCAALLKNIIQKYDKAFNLGDLLELKPLFYFLGIDKYGKTPEPFFTELVVLFIEPTFSKLQGRGLKKFKDYANSKQLNVINESLNESIFDDPDFAEEDDVTNSIINKKIINLRLVDKDINEVLDNISKDLLTLPFSDKKILRLYTSSASFRRIPKIDEYYKYNYRLVLRFKNCENTNKSINTIWYYLNGLKDEFTTYINNGKSKIQKYIENIRRGFPRIWQIQLTPDMFK